MPDANAAPERRQNLKLRAVFDEVYERIVPFIDPARTWGGKSLEHFAFRTIRESHPGLTPSEVHQLIVASVRVFGQRNPALAAGLPKAGEIAARIAADAPPAGRL